MMELHILGTASARPTSSRSVSGSVLSTEEGLIVIDAGEGFQVRYLAQRSLDEKERSNCIITSS
jgi:ribonuclease BN (tRNA processing enzyme)